jgi:hypothetical protein
MLQSATAEEGETERTKVILVTNWFESRSASYHRNEP